MPAIATPRPSAVATRIARLLRPAALSIDAWVSTEAAVQLPGHPLLRPAVAVVQGDLPYNGVVTSRPVLVVEVDEERVTRWASLRLPAVWGPCAGAAVEITGTTRRVRSRDESLAVPQHAALTLPVAELCPAAVDNVIHLPR